MKRTSIIILFTLLIIACDPITEIEIDKTYILGTNCGFVNISGVKFQTNSLLISQEFDGGGFIIDIDNLRHQIIPPEGNNVVEMSLLQDGFEVRQSKLKLENEEIVLRLKFRNKIEKGDVLFILPCDYIKCNTTALITETIRIKI